MTPQQGATLAWIRSFMREHGYAPTLREIGGHFGISSTSAFERVHRLVDAGHLKLVAGRRGLRPTGVCPCCGRGWTDD